MTRQYIGARYIPIFDGEFNPNKNYEALTTVNYYNSMYISKKPVPAGTVPTNENYWALVSNYNAQVDEYRQQVEAYKEEVDALKIETEEGFENVTKPLNNRVFLFIGDSYADVDSGNDYVDYIKAYLPSAVIYKSAKKSCGFIGDTNVSAYDTTFEHLLQVAVVPSKTAITDIIVLGGVNDYNSTGAIENAISAFMNTAKTQYPNATVHLGMLSYSMQSTQTGWLGTVLTEYQKIGKYGGCYISNCEFILHDRALLGADKLHPTDDGNKVIANYICGYMLNRNIDVHKDRLAITKGNNVTATSVTMELREEMHNNLVSFNTASPITIMLDVENYACDGTHIITFCEITNGYIAGSGGFAGVNVPCFIYDAGSYYPATINLFLENMQLKGSIMCIVSGQASWRTAHLTNIVIPRFESVVIATNN